MRDTLPPDHTPATANPIDLFRERWQNGSRPDVTAFLADAGPIQPDVVVDILRIDQEQRWRLGEEIPVETYLEQFPQIAADEDGLKVLVYGELLARTERGERPALIDFILRFPQLAEFLTLQWEVHDALEGVDGNRGSTMTYDEPAIPPAMTVTPSLVVPGYEIEAEVGRGAVGVVYKAQQAAINRPCALKVVFAGEQDGTEKLRRFFEEGRAIGRLKHPNIVGIYDLGTHETGPFMALEWVGGGTLADKLAAEPIDPAEAARLTATLARAVGHAHENGIVHRDLKPSNVLLTEAGEPKIADFGLAKYTQVASAAGRTSVAGAPIGTPTYMAPEQTGMRKGEITPAADVYSLGAILYEMLTGRVPLLGATVQDTLRLIAEQDPVSPRELNAQVSRDLETVCLKCLEKEPKKRYANGHALADDLGRVLAGEPTTARPVGPIGRAARWLVRHPRWAVGVSVGISLAALTGVALVAGLVRLSEERRRAELAERAAVERLHEELKIRTEARGKEWRALVNEATAIRRSGRPGQRTEALAKIREAKAVLDEVSNQKPAPDDLMLLRNEAIACLALYDVEAVDSPLPPVVFTRGDVTRTLNRKPLAAGHDERLAITTDEPDIVRVWDYPAGRLLFITTGKLASNDPIEPDGRTVSLAAGDRTVRLRVIVATGYRILDLPPPPEAREGPVVRPDGKQSVIAGGHGVLHLLDVAANRPLARLEVPESTRLLPRKFTADETITAAGVESRAIHGWDLQAIRAELKILGLDWSGP